MTVVTPLVIISVMVAFNALYVAAEFATVGSRRSRVQESAEGGSASAGRLLAVLSDATRLDNYVAACQVGITLSSLVAGAYGQAQLTPLLEPALGSAGRPFAVLIVLVFITAFQVVLGELLPKTAALRYPERLAMATMKPMQVSQWVFRPLVAVFNGSAFALMRALKLTVDHGHAHVHSPEELAGLYRASAAGGLIDAAERDMLAGVLNVESRLVREIMTPRRRLTTISAAMPVAEALDLVAGSPHSRFPVVTEHDDDITGMVHLRDLYLATQERADRPAGDLARPVLAVGEMLTVPALWRNLREEAQHCALVVNEFGSVAGMVTLEDAIEEIFGEVLDEFDQEDDPIVVTEGRASVRGDVLLETIVHRLGVSFPAVDAETIGGLVLHHHHGVLRVGAEVRIGDDAPAVRVDDLDGSAIARVSFDLPGEVGS